MSSPSEEDLPIPVRWAAAVIVFEGVFAFIGNLWVLLTVLVFRRTTPKLRSSSFTLIAMLAFTDFAVGLLYILLCFIPDTTFFGDYMSPFICNFVGFYAHTFCALSVITLAIISWERHTLIVKRKSVTTRKIVKIYLIVSVFCVAYSTLPFFGLGEYQRMPSGNLCWSQGDVLDPLLIVSISIMIVSFVVMVRNYGKVIKFTRGVADALREKNVNVHQQDRQSAAMKLTKLFVLITVLFAFNWSFCLFQWIYTLSGYKNRAGIDILSSFMASANSCINPLLYAIYNKVIWRKMKDFLGLLCGKSMDRRVQTKYTVQSTTRFTRGVPKVTVVDSKTSSAPPPARNTHLMIPMDKYLVVPANNYMAKPLLPQRSKRTNERTREAHVSTTTDAQHVVTFKTTEEHVDVRTVSE